MPNWCNNTNIIHGPREEIVPLYEKLVSWTSKNYRENDFGVGWLGNIVLGAGFSLLSEDKKDGLFCRGNVEDSFQTVEGENKYGFFQLYEDTIWFSSTTAWGPMPDMWYKILEKYAPHCRYFYLAEEPGMGIYCSNDIDHEYFSDEYVVDVTYWDEKRIPKKYLETFDEDSYDWTTEELIPVLQDFTNSKETDMDTLIDLFKKQERIDLGNEGYVSINRIKYNRE